MRPQWLALPAILFASATADGIDVSPAFIDVWSSHTGITQRTLALTSNLSTAVTVALRLQFPTRRLQPAEVRSSSDRGSGRSSGHNSSGRNSSGRNSSGSNSSGSSSASGSRGSRRGGSSSSSSSGSSSSQSKGDACKIMARLRDSDGDANGQGRGAPLRRRLTSDENLRIKSWRHLKHVSVDVIELDCEAGLDAQSSLEYLQDRYEGGLELAELDRRVFPIRAHPAAASAPDDPSWSALWGMHRVGAAEAWARLAASRGAARRPTTVAIVDTGVELDHEDLRGALWTNPGEVPGNGVDDDGNGYVDDVHGYDFANDDSDPSDDDGHGTHCAGVVGAVADNAKGIAGVAGHGEVQLMALKFMTPDGGMTSDAVRAIDYAVEMGASISSHSWGGSAESRILQAAMRAAASAGHLLVTAAGNENVDVDADPLYPCSMVEDFGLCVGATTRSDTWAGYSNYGAGTVHLAAPGSSILSTYPGGNYRRLSGTSMACPFAAGAAALLWSTQSGLTAGVVRKLILDSAERAPWLNARVETGLLDVLNLVTLADLDSWLSFQNGVSSGPTVAVEVAVGPGSTVDVGLEVGFAWPALGSYTATVVAEWPGGTVSVPASYELQGWPLLVADWGDGPLELDFGVVLLDSLVGRNATLRNVGNGTAHVRLGDLPPPFSSSAGDVELAPSKVVRVMFYCSPSSLGSWEANVTVQTNSGAGPRGSSLAGEAFEVALACTGRLTPHLDMDVYSGAALLPSSGGGAPAAARPRHLQPSVPAEWESSLPGGSVEAPVVAAASGNGRGCQAHGGDHLQGCILLVSRGSCLFQLKAQHAEDSGAVGVLVYDLHEQTTIGMMMMPDDGSPNPGIPAFLVTKAEGLALRQRLAAGEEVNASLRWEPVTMWAGHPSHEASGAVRLSSMGPDHAPYRWSAEISMFSDSDRGQFYEAALLPAQWASGPAPELESFSDRVVDDDEALVALPFPFPLYGRAFGEVAVSSNGVLAFGERGFPHGYGEVPSTGLPNGLVAPFWADLVSAQYSRLSVLHSPEEGFVAFQYANFTFWSEAAAGTDYSSSPRVTFEARLFASGRIEVSFLDFPPWAGRSGQVGVESLDGRHGQSLAQSLPFSDGRPFSVALAPWLAPTAGLAGAAGRAGGSIAFAARGGQELQAWLVVAAADESGTWTSTMRARLVQRVFTSGWSVGPWGSCLGGTRSRPLECLGSDGSVYPDARCAETGPCTDFLVGWRDSSGNSCDAYATNGWCTDDGGYGPNWRSSWGNFESYHNHTAATACCACGGGSFTTPASTEVCPTPSPTPAAEITTTLVTAAPNASSTPSAGLPGTSTISTTTSTTTGTSTRSSWMNTTTPFWTDTLTTTSLANTTTSSTTVTLTTTNLTNTATSPSTVTLTTTSLTNTATSSSTVTLTTTSLTNTATSSSTVTLTTTSLTNTTTSSLTVTLTTTSLTNTATSSSTVTLTTTSLTNTTTLSMTVTLTTTSLTNTATSSSTLTLTTTSLTNTATPPSTVTLTSTSLTNATTPALTVTSTTTGSTTTTTLSATRAARSTVTVAGTATPIASSTFSAAAAPPAVPAGAARIAGAMLVTVDDAEEFVADAGAREALQESIAAVVDVPAAQISVSLSLARRLAGWPGSARHLQGGQAVSVDYVIEVPVRDTDEARAAIDMVAALAAVTPSAMTQLVQAAMDEKAGGRPYVLQVTSIPRPLAHAGPLSGPGESAAESTTTRTTQGPAPALRAGEAGSAALGWALAAAGGVSSACLAAVICARRRRRSNGPPLEAAVSL